MDENDKAKLESAQRELEKYIQHPYTQRITAENATAQDTLQRLIINDDVRDVETLVAHFVAIGHLRGLRQASASLNETLAAIKEDLAQ